MTNKPVDLIVAVTMHEVAGDIAKIRSVISTMEKAGMKLSSILNPDEEIARKLLCTISHDASMVDVFRALAAVGAPSSVTDIKEGLQAIKDRMPVT